jgi:hypothetical protein
LNLCSHGFCRIPVLGNSPAAEQCFAECHILVGATIAYALSSDLNALNVWVLAYAMVDCGLTIEVEGCWSPEPWSMLVFNSCRITAFGGCSHLWPHYYRAVMRDQLALPST